MSYYQLFKVLKYQKYEMICPHKCGQVVDARTDPWGIYHYDQCPKTLVPCSTCGINMCREDI